MANSMETKSFRGARRTGRWVRLMPVVPSDVQFLYRLATDEIVGLRWRHHGTVPSFEQFQQTYNNGVLTHFTVEAVHDSVAMGYVVAYGADLDGGTAYVGGVMDPNAVGTGFAIEAMEVFIDYLFATYAFRKLYFEVPEYNMSQFSRGYKHLLKEEGRQREHLYYGGEFWDRYLLAVYREDYEQDAGVARRRSNRLRNQ
jgi:RimJ/RimL family protein N-acetyltransferase